VGAHLEDLRSDFSAIHRVPPDELERMPAPRAYSLAYRISAYETVTRARLRAQHVKKTAPAGPREMKASQWLAQNPQALKGFSRTKFDLTKGRPHGIQDR